MAFTIIVIGALTAGLWQPPAPPAQTASTVEEYVIGPQDILGVVFWREPELSGDVTVRPDGRVTLPVLGELQAAGLRPQALQAAIQAAAEKYLTDPNVAVVVRTINSRKVYVTGRVSAPGAHVLTGPLTVLQALAMSGGLTEFADEKNVAVLRRADGTTQTFKFNYRDVSRGRKVEQNILLLPGDTVVVP